MTSSNFLRYWPFVRGIHRWPVNSPHKGQWRGALMFSLICAWINGWVNSREAGDLRCHRAHYDVIVMRWWRQLNLFLAEYKNTPMLHRLMHGFEWPGDARVQGISSNIIDMAFRNNPVSPWNVNRDFWVHSAIDNCIRILFTWSDTGDASFSADLDLKRIRQFLACIPFHVLLFVMCWVFVMIP